MPGAGEAQRTLSKWNAVSTCRVVPLRSPDRGATGGTFVDMPSQTRAVVADVHRGDAPRDVPRALARTAPAICTPPACGSHHAHPLDESRTRIGRADWSGTFACWREAHMRGHTSTVCTSSAFPLGWNRRPHVRRRMCPASAAGVERSPGVAARAASCPRRGAHSLVRRFCRARSSFSSPIQAYIKIHAYAQIKSP